MRRHTTAFSRPGMKIAMALTCGLHVASLPMAFGKRILDQSSFFRSPELWLPWITRALKHQIYAVDLNAPSLGRGQHTGLESGSTPSWPLGYRCQTRPGARP